MTTKHGNSEAKALIGYHKGAIILGLIAREHGATLKELVKASGWVPNSIYGFVSSCKRFRRIRAQRDQWGSLRYMMY